MVSFVFLGDSFSFLKHEFGGSLYDFEDRVFGCIRIRWDVSFGGSGCGILTVLQFFGPAQTWLGDIMQEFNNDNCIINEY
uniref:Uncharacterized protein n=1 Tax=Rhizophagus irregularis (strain DAOM 181602 / DAOM 197198 / MUCL 43194) TaxID=747089 RepID=U9SKH9_RHIID